MQHEIPAAATIRDSEEYREGGTSEPFLKDFICDSLLIDA